MNAVDVNGNIFAYIYNFKVVDDDIDHFRTTPQTRVRKWDSGITEYMVMINGVWDYHKIGSPAIDSDDPHFIAFYCRGKIYTDSVDYCKWCGFDDAETALFILKYGHVLPSF